MDPSWLATAVVALLAFSAYVLVLAPAPYLLDSAELAAASHGLGIAHPPGETVAILWGKLFCLLPLGSVAFRVGLSQAVAGGAATALVHRLALRLLAEQALTAGARRLLALTAAAAFALAPGVVMSANRPEVYALGTALGLGALLAAGRDDPRAQALAALLLGLGMGNHPLISAAAALGVAVALAPWLRGGAQGIVSSTRLLVLMTAALMAAMAVLLYLPARALALHASAAIDLPAWGDGRTLAGLRWILSAQTFVGKTAVVQQNADPMALPFVLLEELGALSALALLGLALGLLRPAARNKVGVLAAVTAGALLAALRAGLDPHNPDIRGYLGLGLAGLALLGVLGLAILLGELRRPRLHLVIATALVMLTTGAGLLRLPDSSLARARAADVATAQALDSAPPRSVLLTSHFETAFLFSYQRLVEGRRPDVDWVHLGFVRGPGYADRLGAARPSLVPLLRAHRQGPLQPGALLALDRPLLIEPDAQLSPSIQSLLHPRQWLWRISADEPPTGPAALAEHEESLFVEASRDRQVRGFFAFRIYGDALLACARGMRPVATLRLRELGRLLPDDERARALLAACAPAPVME